MNYSYYIINKQQMSIIDMKPDFVEAYNAASGLSFPCAIFQGCFLTETAPVSQEVVKDEED